MPTLKVTTLSNLGGTTGSNTDALMIWLRTDSAVPTTTALRLFSTNDTYFHVAIFQ